MIQYSTGQWSLLFLLRWRGSVFPKALVWAIPAAALARFFNYAYFENHEAMGLPRWEQASSVGAIWSSFNFVIGFLVVFRTQAAYARYWEGATLVQQGRAHLFNACSSLVAFSSPDRRKRDLVEEFQHLLVRLMSMMHCVGLQTVADMEDVQFEFFNTDGMDQSALRFLAVNSDKHQRCEIVNQWIQRLVVDASRAGIIDVPPPILSRFFQELSQGATHMINARIMTGIPFPFPYAQMLTSLLIFHWLITPFMCVMLLRENLWSCIFSFISVFALWGMNYIAAEIESPFGDDLNDLPIHTLQKDMNKSLWILLHPNTQAVPKFKFNPAVHRKWDVICQATFNNVNAESRSLFKPSRTSLWTQKENFASEDTMFKIPSAESTPTHLNSWGSSSVMSFFRRSRKKSTRGSVRTRHSHVDAGESELPPPFSNSFAHEFSNRSNVPSLGQIHETDSGNMKQSELEYPSNYPSSTNSPTHHRGVNFSHSCSHQRSDESGLKLSSNSFLGKEFVIEATQFATNRIAWNNEEWQQIEQRDDGVPDEFHFEYQKGASNKNIR